jgi:hypothetical protein
MVTDRDKRDCRCVRGLTLACLLTGLWVGSPASLRGQNAEPTANPPGTQAQHVSTRDPDWAVLIEKEHNLHRVTPTFYRSAQIDKSMVTRLKELGVVTVVNLRESDSDAKILQDSGITTHCVRSERPRGRARCCCIANTVRIARV